jgi:hypothetical protein
LACPYCDAGVEGEAEGVDGGEANWVVGGEAAGRDCVGLDRDPHLVLRTSALGDGDCGDGGAGVGLDDVGADGLKIDRVAPVDEEDCPGAEGARFGVLGDWGKVWVADYDDF